MSQYEESHESLHHSIGRAFCGDGLASIVSGMFGGCGTTTYAENIGVMAATKVYSTLVYVVASAVAMMMSLCPKFGALVECIPQGVLGGAGIVLCGMIAVLGARLWVENCVDLRSAHNLVGVGTCLILGAANFGINIGPCRLEGVGLGSIVAVLMHQLRSVPSS